MDEEKKKRGRPKNASSPERVADKAIAETLRPWEGWEGSWHCRDAAHQAALSLGFVLCSTKDDPDFMGLRNSFKSYCNLWRKKPMRLDWELPEDDGWLDTLPTPKVFEDVWKHHGLTNEYQFIEKLTKSSLLSNVQPKRKSGAGTGKPNPRKLILGIGPGSDPEGYRKQSSVRYGGDSEQMDLYAVKYMDMLISAQQVALRVAYRNEDVETAWKRHDMIVQFNCYTHVVGVSGRGWDDWYWHEDMMQVKPDIESHRQHDSSCGRFSIEGQLYSLIAYLRLRRESGGAAGAPSLLYCAHPHCPSWAFMWEGTIENPDLKKRGKATRPTHYCPACKGSAKTDQERRRREKKQFEKKSRDD